MQSKMEPTGHTFTVWHDFGGRRDSLELILLGGYSSGKKTIVLFRYDGPCEDVQHDGSMELLAHHNIRPVTDARLALDVESGDWNRYADLPVGTRFTLGRKVWTKRSPDDLAKRLSEPLFAT